MAPSLQEYRPRIGAHATDEPLLDACPAIYAGAIVTVRTLRPTDVLAIRRDEPLVCMPWSAGSAQRDVTLEGLLAHTPTDVSILLAGVPAEELPTLEASLRDGARSERELCVVALDAPVRFAAALAVAAGLAPRADLAIVLPGTRVGPEWLAGMRAAAHSDSTVVSATALADHAGSLSVLSSSSGAPPDRQSGGSGQAEADAAARAVAESSPRAYPRIAGGAPHCLYLRRAMLDSLVESGEDPGDPETTVAELSLRALRRGMVHVAADDVYVMCEPRADPAVGGDAAVQAGGPSTDGVSAIAALREIDRSDDRSVLRRSLASARVALWGLSVTIDARALGPAVGGTQIYTVELVLALARSGRVRVRVVAPPDLSPVAVRAFASEPAVEVIDYERAAAGVELTDVVHRPQQVFSEDDLALLHMLGERVVIGQQDLIGYRNPAYHASLELWQRYRRITRLALASADRVVFFSRHAEHDAVVEDLVDSGQAAVVGIGADVLWELPVEPVRPKGAPEGGDLLLCLGADYEHKNRPFAIALLDALRRRHGWRGQLVLAGPHVPHGSSREEELALLAEHPDLAEAIVDLGLVDEAGKAWLYAHAQAVVYPSTYEGFGLLPFEAARAGIPCLFAPQASLTELAGPEIATLVPWDAEASADAVAGLLAEGPERSDHLERLQAAAATTRWSDVVGRLLDSYERAVRAPQRAAAPRVWEALERERYIDELDAAMRGSQEELRILRDSVGVLAGPAQGGLLSESQRRGLVRAASRPLLRRLLLSPLGLLGRRW
jgi:glycosyltransferase involved in cell wall biosynthesis